MGRVSSTDRQNFKNSVNDILSADNYKLVKATMENLFTAAQTIIDGGVAIEDIELEIWIVPKLRKPGDGNPANYFTRKTKWKDLDFDGLYKLILSAIDPVYNTANEPTLLLFYDAVTKLKTFTMHYRFNYPKSDPEETGSCEIIIPENQVTQ